MNRKSVERQVEGGGRRGRIEREAKSGSRRGGERTRESLFVTVSGLSRSIISRKVLLTALIFRLFLYRPLVSLFFFPPPPSLPPPPAPLLLVLSRCSLFFVFNR